MRSTSLRDCAGTQLASASASHGLFDEGPPRLVSANFEWAPVLGSPKPQLS